MLKISKVADLQVGDVGFYTIAGRVGGFVSFGQWLIDAVALIQGKNTEGSWFTHAFLVIQENGESRQIIEAMPGGARLVWLRGSDRTGYGYGYARLGLTEGQRGRILSEALALEGTPYSFLDYLSIALLHLGLPRKFTAKRVADSGHMICSQLVDFVLCRVGMKLFADGRVSQDVTPGALFRKAGGIGEVMWW